MQCRVAYFELVWILNFLMENVLFHTKQNQTFCATHF